MQITKEKSSDSRQHKGIDTVSGRQRVTMYDIARVAGCSQPTVSFVLNNNQSVKISEHTKQRVIDAACELGYRPKVLHALSSESTIGCPSYFNMPIAFVIDNLAGSPEGVHAFDGVMDAVRAIGSVVMLAETGNDPLLESKVLQHFIDQKVAAIIYACVFTRQVEVPEILKNSEIPIFLLNCYSEDLSINAVVPGEVGGGHNATNALLQAGHTRIGIITGEPFMEGARDRLIGYRNALATADLPFDEDLVIEGNWLPSTGYDGAQKLMALPEPPTAIFCQNDRMAIGCYEALKELGLSIPEDVSVIGYDDDELARYLSPPLTSVRLASQSLGRWAVEQLFYGNISRTCRHPITKLECELIKRESICPPRTKK